MTPCVKVKFYFYNKSERGKFSRFWLVESYGRKLFMCMGNFRQEILDYFLSRWLSPDQFLTLNTVPDLSRNSSKTTTYQKLFVVMTKRDNSLRFSTFVFFYGSTPFSRRIHNLKYFLNSASNSQKYLYLIVDPWGVTPCRTLFHGASYLTGLC
jgi:hypothetical protein